MLVGLDQIFDGRLAQVRRRLRDARVGVLTHAAAVDRRGRHLLTVLAELGASPSIVFTPEHGLDASAQALEAVPSPAPALTEAEPSTLPSRPDAEAAADAEDQADPAGAIGDAPGRGPVGAPRVVSLYGDTRASLQPTAADLGQLDVLIIDLQDVGSRYYTYVWTALLATRAAARAGVHVLLLDRPNPIGGDPASLEGAPQSEELCSFVGLEPLPIRHSLTYGEIVAHFAERDGLALGATGALAVIGARGWERRRTSAAWGRPFVPPSPNMPTLETALVYPGACLLEGTNLSEGRGTTTPFQTVGAPWLDGERLARDLAELGTPGAWVRPVAFKPTFEKHAGTLCQGVMVHVTDPGLFRPVAAYLHLIALARAQAPESFRFRTEAYEFETEKLAFDLLTGAPRAREALVAGARPDEVSALVCPVDPSWREVVHAAEARVEMARP